MRALESGAKDANGSGKCSCKRSQPASAYTWTRSPYRCAHLPSNCAYRNGIKHILRAERAISNMLATWPFEPSSTFWNQTRQLIFQTAVCGVRTPAALQTSLIFPLDSFCKGLWQASDKAIDVSTDYLDVARASTGRKTQEGKTRAPLLNKSITDLDQLAYYIASILHQYVAGGLLSFAAKFDRPDARRHIKFWFHTGAAWYLKSFDRKLGTKKYWTLSGLRRASSVTFTPPRVTP